MMRPVGVGLMSRGPLYPLASLFEAVAQITGKEPMLTRDALTMSKRHMFFTSAKAQDELGYAARPYIEAIADAMAWFKAHGYIR